jgi:hypothetical protein
LPAAPFLRFWDHKQTGAGAGITSDCKKISGGRQVRFPPDIFLPECRAIFRGHGMFMGRMKRFYLGNITFARIFCGTDREKAV